MNRRCINIRNCKLILSVFLLIVMISAIGVVNASDVIEDDLTSAPTVTSNDNDFTENVNSNEAISDSANQKNSFKDLDSKIATSNEVNLTGDYYFDEEKDTDYKDGISIKNRENLVINGNNHTINANNLATIFDISSSEVVFNNIIFKNSNKTAVKMIDSDIVSNNNLFVNNRNNSRALEMDDSSLYSSNDSFVDNYHDILGSSILAEDSILFLANDKFTNKYSFNWASVYVTGESSKAYIINSTFINLTAKYTPAIFFDSGEGTVRNCVFKNLSASLTGGAIGVKNVDGNVSIINSSFINVTSYKNGGAIFVDLNQLEVQGNVLLKNCLFDSCFSVIGGAYLQLGGTVTLDNTTFKNNCAGFQGGAVYTSFADLNIKDCSFKDNIILLDDEYYSSGGALYLDMTTLVMTDSTFTGNNATNGEDLLLYDCDYNITGSSFDGNIYSIYDGDSFLENNTFKKENKFNDTYNPYIYVGPGGNIEYDPVILDESLVNTSYFNLVDYGLVTEVKDQGNMGACWAFGTVGSLESAFLKATNRKLSLDISENNVQNLGLKYSPYGNLLFEEGATRTVGTSYFLSWLGVTSVEDDEYDELGKLSPVIDPGNKYFVYDVVYIEPRQNMTDNLKLKEALIKYGAIGISLHGARGAAQEDYNDETASAYYNSTFGMGTDHSVTLVGWDDNYSKENFLITPPGDGAWIIKNSWGTDWGNNGYYYVSYYDTAVATSKTLTAFTVGNSYDYERNYEYDLISMPIFKNDITGKIAYANKFNTTTNELITAVGTYFNDSGVDYEITVYVDDEEIYTQNGTSSHYGYETIKLHQGIGVKENHTFIIQVVSNNVPASTYSRQHYEKNTSFVFTEEEMQDISAENVVACLKAYTITDNSQIKTTNLTTRYNSGEYVKVTYYDENGKVLSNHEVQFIINNKTYTRTTDDDGIAVLDVNLKAGTYIVTVVNPVSLEKTNITLTILKIPTKKVVPTNSIRHNTKQITGTLSNPAYKIYTNDKLVSQTNTITIETLNTIFNQSFTNGHLLVYIDGTLIFNDTVTYDLYTMILEITGKYLGEHEIKVVFTDNQNKTNTYKENIKIR